MRCLPFVVLLVGVTSCRSADEKRELDRARNAEWLALPPHHPTHPHSGSGNYRYTAPDRTTPRPGR